MISKVLKSHAQEKEVKKIPKFDLPMPSVYPLDPRKRPEIIPMPMYLKDESKLDDVVDLLYLMQTETGMTDEQIINKLVQCRGDLKTSQINR
jgi:hypothetical protein